MTSKEFRACAREANDAIKKITMEFKKRIQELYVIAQEKGYGTEFGWTEGEVEKPYEDDFETEEEFEEAEDKYEDFRDSCMEFLWTDYHNFIPYDGYSFVIDEDGSVTFTSVMAIADVEDKAFCEDTHYGFYPYFPDNWRACVHIIA